MADNDRVSYSNLVASGGFYQTIPRKKWTPLKDKTGVYKVTMPDGSTKINAWLSFDQPTTGRAENFQIRIMREGGDFTARNSYLLTTRTDVGLVYGWEMSTGPNTVSTIWVEVWHDADADLQIGEFEVHYKHIPEVIVK